MLYLINGLFHSHIRSLNSAFTTIEVQRHLPLAHLGMLKVISVDFHLEGNLSRQTHLE